MANHCYNWIVFTGSKDSIKRLEAEAFGTYTKFNTFNDWVNSVVGNEDDSNQDAYKYGTRWFEFEIQEVSDEHLIVAGSSAWNPPIDMTRVFCEHFELSANHEYEEGGMDYGGYIKVDTDGEITEEFDTTYHHWRYIEDSSSYFENLMYDIEDNTYESIDELLSHNHFLTDEEKKEITAEWLKSNKHENV